MTRRAALTLGLVTCLTARAAHADGRVVAAYIVSRVGDAGAADAQPKRARIDQTVTLFAVIEAVDGDRHRYYSDAGELRLGGKSIAARPAKEAPPVTLAWAKVEPTTTVLSNEASGAFAFEPIPYAETPVKAWAGRWQVVADVHPTATTDHGNGVGTMRFQLTAVSDGTSFATPGKDARRGKGSGGLTDAVHRISLRRGDDYLGRLTELYGQPYIWASAGRTDATHQSERLEGSDCADFVVYGRRRLGKPTPYTWTGGLPAYTTLIARGHPNGEGTYVDERGKPLAFPQPGDLVLFPRHVGVVVEDRGDAGVLDGRDLMMHSYFDSPREQAIGDSDYAAADVEIRRWKRGY